jgi:hypothetical protein
MVQWLVKMEKAMANKWRELELELVDIAQEEDYGPTKDENGDHVIEGVGKFYFNLTKLAQELAARGITTEKATKVKVTPH